MPAFKFADAQPWTGALFSRWLVLSPNTKPSSSASFRHCSFIFDKYSRTLNLSVHRWQPSCAKPRLSPFSVLAMSSDGSMLPKCTNRFYHALRVWTPYGTYIVFDGILAPVFFSSPQGLRGLLNHIHCTSIDRSDPNQKLREKTEPRLKFQLFFFISSLPESQVQQLSSISCANRLFGNLVGIWMSGFIFTYWQ